MSEKPAREYNQFGLRQRLFEAMDALRRGDIEYEDAKATASLASQIIASDRVDIEIYRMKLLDAKPVGHTDQKTIEDKRG